MILQQESCQARKQAIMERPIIRMKSKGKNKKKGKQKEQGNEPEGHDQGNTKGLTNNKPTVMKTKEKKETKGKHAEKSSFGFRPYHVTGKWKQRYQKDNDAPDMPGTRINPDEKFWATKRRHERDSKRKEKKDNKRRTYEALSDKRNKALTKYSQTKKEQHKKLAKRNYKGQPNMASRMEILLSKIEQGRQDT